MGQEGGAFHDIYGLSRNVKPNRVAGPGRGTVLVVTVKPPEQGGQATQVSAAGHAGTGPDARGLKRGSCATIHSNNKNCERALIRAVAAKRSFDRIGDCRRLSVLV